MKEIAKEDHELVRSNLELIQENKKMAKRISELESRNKALEAYVASSKAHKRERLLRQRMSSDGGWPKLKTALLGMFNLAVVVFLVVTF